MTTKTLTEAAAEAIEAQAGPGPRMCVRDPQDGSHCLTHGGTFDPGDIRREPVCSDAVHDKYTRRVLDRAS